MEARGAIVRAMTIEALRTANDRFADLPDWPYAPLYIDDLGGHAGMVLTVGLSR